MRHLYVLANNVWAAATYIGWRDRDESSDPKRTDNYMFDTLEKAKALALTLDADSDIYNQGFIYHGEVPDEKILELTGCETMEEFEELLEDPECKGKFNEKRELAEYIVREFDNSVISDVECANYDIDKSIEGAIIVIWQWVRYVGYARKLLKIYRARAGETETMLAKKDNTFVPQADVVLTAEQADACDDLPAAILEELDDERWKWVNPSAMRNASEWQI